MVSFCKVSCSLAITRYKDYFMSMISKIPELPIIE